MKITTATLPSVDDPILGHMHWVPSLGEWDGKVFLFPWLRVNVCVVHNYDSSATVVMEMAHLALARIREREAEYRRWTATQLLEQRWNKETPMTVEDIAALIRAASLVFVGDGKARIFWYDRGVLYGGNNIVTDLSPTGDCLAVRMEGVAREDRMGPGPEWA